MEYSHETSGIAGVFHSPCFYLFTKRNKNLAQKEHLLKNNF